MSEKVRVRFAPSPTGPLHIGGVRTALYNYLFAKKHGGDFVLRIEDTDRSRFVKGAEEYIYETFDWLGFKPDEGVIFGGDAGPYKQSERKDIYQQYAQQLIHEKKAYLAFDTPEELDAMRRRLQEAKAENQVYDRQSRQTMRNSLTLSEKEVVELIERGEPYVIRLKVDGDDEVVVNDLIRGEVIVPATRIDDKVLVKSDGMPTYHLANVVDDHLMGITHVIRGEEWLPSAPLHVLLYQYLGWENEMPQFAHLPLLLKPDGNGKLSKRDADKHGYPVFPLEWTNPDNGEKFMGFREQGYLPEAVINFLALLGWNPGTDQELFTLEALVESFSIDRINKSGARFDIDKAKWFNQQYLKKKDDHELAEGLLDVLEKEGISCTLDKATAICGLMKERVIFPREIYTSAKYFFFQPVEYDGKIMKKRWNDEVKKVITEFGDELKKSDTFAPDSALNTLKAVLERNNMGMGKVMQALRAVITGTGGGPDLMGIIEVLGRDEVVSRIENAIKKLP